MTSSGKIEMYFAEIMHLSEQLCQMAKTLKAVGEEGMQIVCENRACWNSRCGDILTGKEVKINAELKREADKLDRIAREMERQAKQMYQSELVNKQLATTRIY